MSDWRSELLAGRFKNPPETGGFCAEEECQKPQPPLLLKKVLQYTSNLYCNTPPLCIAVLSVPLSTQEREILQYSSHLYRSTPPICTAIHLPFVLQYHLLRNRRVLLRLLLQNPGKNEISGVLAGQKECGRHPFATTLSTQHLAVQLYDRHS